MINYFLIGFYLSIFTSLRFSLIGFGEILMIISLIIFFLNKKIILNNYFSFIIKIFWLPFFIIVFLSTFYNFFISEFINYNLEKNIKYLSLNLSSYLFILVTLTMLVSENFIKNYSSIKTIINYYIFFNFFLLLLFVLYFFEINFLASNLRIYDGFAPFVENVHQIVRVLIFIPFLNLFLATSFKLNKYLKFFLIINTIIVAYLILETNSFKGQLSLLISCVSFIFVFLLKKIKFDNFIKILFTISLFLILIIYFSELLHNLFIENDGHDIRKILYINALLTSTTNLFLGHGAGILLLIENNYYEAHNTLLSILIQSGIVPFILFIIFFLKLLIKLYNNIFLFSSLIASTPYILGGDILRNIQFWFFLYLLVYFNNFLKKKII